MAGVKLVHVPYKGMPASNIDVMTGRVQLGFPSFTSVFPLVKAGKLKAFAITMKKRSALAPDIPTMDEAGVPGYEASIWNGILAPAGTPKADREPAGTRPIVQSTQVTPGGRNVMPLWEPRSATTPPKNSPR